MFWMIFGIVLLACGLVVILCVCAGFTGSD